jgi:hypothetical protein
MWNWFKDRPVLAFEFVPKLLEPFPIGEDFDTFADCGYYIDFLDRLEKVFSFKAFATDCADRGQLLSHCDVVGLCSFHPFTKFD